MIVKTTLAISAEHPNLPLDTAATFVGSAATFSITGVPTIPAISVAAVAVSVTNALGAVSTVAAVSGEDGWTATFPASHFAAAGTVKDGVVVAVSGTDENGAARTWTAGVGTIVILSSSPVPAPGDVVYNVRLFATEPTAPTEGDLWPDGEGGYLLWQDGEAHALGGASIAVDAELSETSENPVQNKVIATALETGYTKWKWNAAGSSAELGQPEYDTTISEKWTVNYDGAPWQADETDESATELHFHIQVGDEVVSCTATRTRIMPTKTSQLTNDGDGTSNFATVAQLPTWNALKPVGGIPATDLASGVQTSLGKADTALQSGDIIAPSDATESGKAADALAVKTALALKADAASLTYALVNATVTNGTAQLTDRAINAVSLSAAATLAFPAQTAGKARDFVVRLTLTETGGVVPSVTFPADVAYETEGGEWPDLTEAGTYIVRLTEVPTASQSETARFFLQCSSSVENATPPSAGGGQ